ncbi:DUF3857 domain-containing transglutaminase family protein [Solitalea canadensis]|uniref:Transglutaminase-like enzyme, predicted cysteine protease n=1 Tax=Solitalea canadensis (strain ATCC 29591 / DSM 3403 / JCM 21819 / LMG 8368 / NBRC 15130 / NCIMB 12057 / USAM 9D) TaxID=929556 RepID=H8KX18_SOLCM|nr:DUF3857 domain-containing transglutaminase family protein [Solitalea canadensis]AFD08347.1 transglutaminase-like enzyme, predicted cysteine protease [Solitalea canadensis DSM 3403]
MKKLFLIAIFCSLTIFQSWADDGKKYPTKDISAELRKDADAVVRFDDAVFTIVNKGSGKFTNHFMVTILNSNGEHWSEQVLSYDKLRPIKAFKGTVYDSTGNVVRKLKSSEIKDYKATQDISLYDDNRVKVATLTHHTFPYTVEFEYEYEYVGLVSYPGWSGLSGYKTSVENSSYTVVFPQDMNIRYKEFNLAVPVKKEIINGKNNYTWSASNLKSIKREPYSVPIFEQGPGILCVPIDFSYEGYDGKMDSWQSFGDWIYKINKDRDKLPDNVKAKVHELTDAAKDPIEKAQILYDYLQKNTRYISVQLGIGGLQTFDANYVATRGYGDCKALSNYMKSLLQEAGVTAHAALIYGGYEPSTIYQDFVNNPFNHVVLAIPTEKETVWLECTSQYNSFNYMGEFTGNRQALLFTPEGGKLVKTPEYNAADNSLIRSAKVKFDLSGTVAATVDAKYKCTRQDDLSDWTNMVSQGRVEKHLYETINIPSLRIKSFNYKAEKGSKPVINEHLELEFSNYINISGKRIFIQPNLLNRMTSGPEKIEKRRSDMLFHFGSTDEDKIVYEIPAGYTLESKPNDVVLKTAFGEFSSSVKLENNELIYTRKFVRNAGRFSAEKYNELFEFLTAISKADKSKVVLVGTAN